MVNTVDIIFVITQIILLSLFYYQTKTRGRAADKLILAVFFGIIASTISVISSFYDGQSYRILLFLQLIVYALEYIFVYLHFKGTITSSYNFIESFIFGLLYGIHFIFGLYYAIYGIEDYSELFWDLSYNLLGIFAFGYMTYCIYLSYIYTRENAALFQTIATGVIVLGFIFSLNDTPIIAGQVGNFIGQATADTIKAVGILVIIIIYTVDPDYIERLPVKTYGIMAFGKGGNTLAYFDTKTRGIFEDATDKADVYLFTSLTRALTSFIKEALGTETELEKIEAQDKMILFDLDEELGVGVIAEHSTKILEESVKRCKARIREYLSTKKQPYTIDPNEISEIVTHSFPYIVIEQNV